MVEGHDSNTMNVRVDERCQMVLPKELRQSADIRVGDKLAVVSRLKEGKI